ncbi:MAG: (Fe-S)-binding protein [Magnetococcales bacterium]|nr:(Fe-S)-binding protein [Magnetococcales bacterium]
MAATPTPPVDHPPFATPPPDPELAGAALCTHCGYCLPVCPTYRSALNEMQSPRGRVSIVLALQGGRLQAEEAVAALSYCLNCRACHPACPANVQPVQLIQKVRSRAPEKTRLSARLLHFITNRPRWTAWLAKMIQFYGQSGLQSGVRRFRLLVFSATLTRLEGLIPPWRAPLTPLANPASAFEPLPSPTNPRPRVGLMAGCLARLFYPGVENASVHLLTQMGFEVVRPPDFGCCGASDLEGGKRGDLFKKARSNLLAFEALEPLEAIICDSATCAVTARQYGKILADDPQWRDQAERFSAKVQPLSRFLAQNHWPRHLTPHDPGLGELTFHDHCQTQNELGTIKEPRALLGALPVKLKELPRAERCCGAGGETMMRHPDASREIRRDKLAAIQASQADTVIGENPGCLLNIEAGLVQEKSPTQVRHLAEALWAAMNNPIKSKFEQL